MLAIAWRNCLWVLAILFSVNGLVCNIQNWNNRLLFFWGPNSYWREVKNCVTLIFIFRAFKLPIQQNSSAGWSLSTLCKYSRTIFRPQAFKKKWIERDGSFPWPCRFLEFTPNAFYLWGHIKYQVYWVLLENITNHKKKNLSHYCKQLKRNTSQSIWKHQKATFVGNSPKLQSIWKKKWFCAEQ